MALRPLPEDFREFIESLNSSKVDYILIGGWAVGLYGNPRTTRDIDFLIAANKANLDRLQKALGLFGAPPVDIENFKIPGNVYRMGRNPLQIDLLSYAKGIDSKKSIKNAVEMNIDNLIVKVISIEDLIENKKATGRLQDLADVEKLEIVRMKGTKKPLRRKGLQ
jgi:predicted nucleotidyltransferase